MQKDMNKAQYKKCDGYAEYIPTKEPVIEKTERTMTALGDEHFESDFMKFVKFGGAYSYRTGKVLFKEG